MDRESLHTQNLPFDLASVAAATEVLAVRHYDSVPWRVVEMDGELDISGVPLMRCHLVGDPAYVVFDLTRVPFMDASTLGIIVTSWRSATRAGGSVRIAGPARQVRRLLTITRLDQIVPVFASLEEALAGPPVRSRDAS